MTDKSDSKPAISFRAKTWRRLSSWYMKRINPKRTDFDKMRARLDTVAGMAPIADGVARRNSEICGLNVAWLTPDLAVPGKLLLYWHGGGYVMGSSKSHAPIVSHIARAARVTALIPEYRLAPEHPYPAAIDDAVWVYRALLADGYKPADIVVAGDSAGGGLTVAMLATLRDAGDPLPDAVFLMSPWLDLSGQGESMISRKDHDPWFDPEHLPHVIEHYCDQTRLRDPLVSPVYADASDLPPTLIQVGEDEILLSDSERFAANMRAAGRPVELDVWPGMWHVWQMFIGLMPESRRAVDKIGKFIRDRVSC